MNLNFLKEKLWCPYCGTYIGWKWKWESFGKWRRIEGLDYCTCGTTMSELYIGRPFNSVWWKKSNDCEGHYTGKWEIYVIDKDGRTAPRPNQSHLTFQADFSYNPEELKEEKYQAPNIRCSCGQDKLYVCWWETSHTGGFLKLKCPDCNQETILLNDNA